MITWVAPEGIVPLPSDRDPMTLNISETVCCAERLIFDEWLRDGHVGTSPTATIKQQCQVRLASSSDVDRSEARKEEDTVQSARWTRASRR